WFWGGGGGVVVLLVSARRRGGGAGGGGGRGAAAGPAPRGPPPAGEREPVPAGALSSEAAEREDLEETDLGIIASRVAGETGALIEPVVDTASVAAQRPRPATD
ncbi:MAG: hypothetical protein ACTHMF_04790, partial [Leifsonia sp.]|uniref:hypothetical protein n=1 Tax=Leifsonia sp. TaxID=1870902 RepID=UPI003F8088DF